MVVADQLRQYQELQHSTLAVAVVELIKAELLDQEVPAAEVLPGQLATLQHQELLALQTQVAVVAEDILVAVAKDLELRVVQVLSLCVTLVQHN
jgi:hypothetical protein